VGAEIGERRLFGECSLHLRRGDRVGLLGPNGSGKSTLVRILAGRRRPDGGTVRHGVGVMIGLLDQEPTFSRPGASVLEELHALRPLASQGEMRAFLARFLFRGDDVFRPIRVLSGGERNRLALARIFLEGPNLLFLDEPTNHLDLDGRLALEDALREYSGTVLAVSHDRAFLNAFSARILYLHDGRVDEHLGDFDDFRRALDATERRAGEGADTARPKGAESRAARKEMRRERQRRERARRDRRERIAEIETEIEELDATLSELAGRMSDAGLSPEDRRALGQEHRAGQTRKEALTAEWEGLVLEDEDDPGEDGPGRE